MEPAPPLGLPNTGNSCYLNSALQALAAPPCVQRHLQSSAAAVSARQCSPAAASAVSSAVASSSTWSHDNEAPATSLLRSTLSLASALWQLLTGSNSDEAAGNESQQHSTHLQHLASCQLVRALAPLISMLGPADSQANTAAVPAVPASKVVPSSMLLPAVNALRAHGAAWCGDGREQDAVEALEAVCDSVQTELSAWLVARWRPGGGLRELARSESAQTAAAVTLPTTMLQHLTGVPTDAAPSSAVLEVPPSAAIAAPASAVIAAPSTAVIAAASVASVAASAAGTGQQLNHVADALSSAPGSTSSIPAPTATHISLHALRAHSGVMSLDSPRMSDAPDGSSVHAGSSAWSRCSDDGGSTCTWSDINDHASLHSTAHTMISAPSETSSFSTLSAQLPHRHHPNASEISRQSVASIAASRNSQGSDTCRTPDASVEDAAADLNRGSGNGDEVLDAPELGVDPGLLHFPEPCKDATQMLHQLPMRGLMASRITCSRCGCSSVQPVTPFWSLHLQLPFSVRGDMGGVALTPPGLTLQACLAKFAQPSALSEFACTKCTVGRAVALASCGSSPLLGLQFGPPAAPQSTPGTSAAATAALQHACAQGPVAQSDVTAEGKPVDQDPTSALRQLAKCLAQLPQRVPVPDLDDADMRKLLGALGFADAAARRAVTQYVPAQQAAWVSHWPGVLVLQLKRSTWDAATGQPLKVHGHVRFPLFLGPDDLTLLSSRGEAVGPGVSTSTGTSGQDSVSEPGNGDSSTPAVGTSAAAPAGVLPTYVLRAAIVHLGGSRSGHYMVYRQAGSSTATTATATAPSSSTVSPTAPTSGAAVPSEISQAGSASFVSVQGSSSAGEGVRGAVPNPAAPGPVPAAGMGDAWYEVSDAHVRRVSVTQVLSAQVAALLYEAVQQ